MRMIHETKQKHLYFSVAFALSIALAPTSAYAVGNPVGSPDASMPQAVQQNGNHKVTGRVVDSAGEPLIGATIMVEGTKEGAVTDIDGNFTINTTSKAKLVISYVGYTTQTILVGDKTTIDVTLKEVANTMNEVVVTALGIKRAEKALSYNVQSVGSNELTRNKDANFVNSLNGKVAGVSISKSASGVGGATRVIMRGAKSIEGDNNVLYVIDGIPIFNFSGGRDSGIMGEGRVSSEGIADCSPLW